MSSNYILEATNITKKYKNLTAVENVNIHIKKGDIYGFIGKNGAGKSTCMKIFSGLSHQTSGTISLFGYSNGDIIKHNIFKKVGSLIESPGMYLNMSAYDNLKMIAYGIGGVSNKDIKDVLEIVNLSSVAKRKSKGYSLGMKQRLGIAIALLNHPKFLILDEPINGLDPQGIVEMRQTIRQINEEYGITIMISSHILEELSKIATRIGVIHKGKMLNEFSKNEFSKNNKIEIEFCTPDISEAVQMLTNISIKCKVTDDNSIVVSDYKEPLGNFINLLVKNNIYVNKINEKNQNLEEYYLQLTKN